MGTRPILQVLKMFPVFLLKKILPCPGPDSGPSQCEYTITSSSFSVVEESAILMSWKCKGFLYLRILDQVGLHNLNYTFLV